MERHTNWGNSYSVWYYEYSVYGRSRMKQLRPFVKFSCGCVLCLGGKIITCNTTECVGEEIRDNKKW